MTTQGDADRPATVREMARMLALHMQAIIGVPTNAEFDGPDHQARHEAVQVKCYEDALISGALGKREPEAAP